MLKACTPVTRLDAMGGFDGLTTRRAKHAAAVRATASAVIDTLADDQPSDRADLARLLSIIGESWDSSLRNSLSFAEQMRWSAVCVSAQQIAERLRTELTEAEEADSTARRSRGVIDFPRRH
jgi:hypothetical protein